MPKDTVACSKDAVEPRPIGMAARAFQPLLAAVIMFFMAAAAATALVWRLEQLRLKETRAHVAALASDNAYELQRRLDRAFSATYALAALVRQGHGTIADFDAVARDMLPLYPEVAALQLAPGGVIRQIAPLAGNEKAIGHNLLLDTARNKEAILARDSGKLTLAGPFELLQGGVGVVARLPVFLTKKPGVTTFWGFTTVLIRFPETLNPTLLSRLAGRGFDYELWRVHPDTGKKQVIAASAAVPLIKPVEHNMNMSNGSWTLSLAPVKGWGDPFGVSYKAALGLLFSLLLAYLAKLLVELKSHKKGLEVLVAERTSALEQSAMELKQELDARRLAEESLSEQKKFAEKLIENSAAATFVLDPQHKIVFWNKACEELTGFTAAAMIGTSNQWQAFYEYERQCLSDIVLDVDYDRFASLYAVYEKSILVPAGLHAEGWYKNLNGRDRYIMFDAAPVYDEKGNVRAAIETLNDTTEHKRADEDLRLQSAALHAAANAIVITDRNGTIGWVNPAFTELTGYTADEAIGRNLRDLVKSGVHDEAFYKNLWNVLLAGEVWRGEIKNRRKDGTIYSEGQTITPVKAADGVITHFIAIKRDLTENIKLEEQLRQSQKMESVGTLAGGIAHDFNNILAAIIGYGQFTLMKMPVDDQLRGYIKNILEAADRAAHLTRELLLFSRKQAIDKKPVDLNLLVAKVEKFLSTVIGEDIEYNTVMHDEPLPVIADSYQFEQILMNLVTNARDAMPKGGTLTVVTTAVTLSREFSSVKGCVKPGSYALITVTDTGEGMDNETQKRIFEPFFTTKEVGKGTGLGLAVVYGIIEQHEGCITVESEPGAGTTFRIYLPLIPTEAIEESKPLADETPVGGSETILLVEDDNAVRILTRKLLEEFGYKVIEAVDGADAISKFIENSEAIDLVLSDLIMPKMSGKEALDEIRKIRPMVKIIFSSGYAPDTVREKVSLEEDVNLISKPVFPSELLRKVRSVLDRGILNGGQ